MGPIGSTPRLLFGFMTYQGRTFGSMANESPNSTYHAGFFEGFGWREAFGLFDDRVVKIVHYPPPISDHNLAVLHPLAVSTNCKAFSPINPAQQQWLLNHVG